MLQQLNLELPRARSWTQESWSVAVVASGCGLNAKVFQAVWAVLANPDRLWSSSAGCPNFCVPPEVTKNPKDHVDRRILQSMVSGILLIGPWSQDV